MSRQSTAGGFEVIPEQAQQYDLLKFYAFVVHCLLGTRWYCDSLQYRQRKNVRKLRYGLCLQIFQAGWAKNYDLLRVIAVHGTMTIKFYV